MTNSTVTDREFFSHRIEISDRKRIEITAVTEICAFDENQVILKTSCGGMRILGKNLHVTSLAPEQSAAIVEGSISSVTYTGKAASRQNALHRLFS